MNSLGLITTRLHCMVEPQDQVRLLSAYLTNLQAQEREIVACMLATPPRAKRLRLSALRNLARERTGERLYALCQDFVGDAAETIALLWQPKPGANQVPAPSDIMQGMADLGPSGVLPALETWMDACDAEGRLLLVRLITGSLKPSASRHVLLQAFANSSVKFLPPATTPLPSERQIELFGQQTSAVGGLITAALLYVHRPTSRSAPMLCTFGIWKNGALLPFGKAPAGDCKDAVSRHVSAHSLKRFGPTTEVEHSDKAALLLQVTYDGVEPSRRHKAGLTLQSPRIVSVSASHAIDDVASIEDLANQLPAFVHRG